MLARGEKTTTISLRTSREFFQPSLASKFQRSSVLSANKYPGSAADSTRRRSGNLPARTLLHVSSRFASFLRASFSPFSSAFLTRLIPGDQPGIRSFSASRVMESFARWLSRYPTRRRGSARRSNKRDSCGNELIGTSTGVSIDRRSNTANNIPRFRDRWIAIGGWW